MTLPNSSSFLFNEDNFKDNLKTIAIPYLESVKNTHKVDSVENGHIHCETFVPDANFKAMIVIFYGFCEYCAKYDEVTFYFLKMGYAVCRFDHFGHGFSSRNKPLETYKVHVDKFSTYVEDAHTILNSVVKPMVGNKPLFLFAHSMGGAIGTLFLKDYAQYFSAAILTSPMFGVRILPKALWLDSILIAILKLFLGKKHCLPGQADHFETNLNYKNVNKPFLSKERYNYFYESRFADEHLQTWSGTVSWLSESLRAMRAIKKIKKNQIRIPVLVFQAEQDETVLSLPQRHFVSTQDTARLEVIKNANHEIYNCPNTVLLDYYTKINDFLLKWINL